MGEAARKIGEKLENFGSLFFTDLGWTEITRDKEIKCTRSSHGKRSHGIDLLFKTCNPYLSCNQGIFLECKDRQMQSINKAEIEKWVKELINCIECAQSAPEFCSYNMADSSLNTGLLVIHANDDKFDKERFYSYISEISVPRRRSPINIYIAANDRINEWTSLCRQIAEFGEDFNLLYPSINGSSKLLTKSFSINSLFSKYNFAISKYFEEKQGAGGTYKEPHFQSILIFRDDIIVNNFKYAWSMFKQFQLQGADRYVFLFYPRQQGDVEYVKEHFILTLKSGDNPISEQEAQKIVIKFIDNRSLSPVEIGGI